MYGDVPEGAQVRLRLKFSEDETVACDPSTVDKSQKEHLYVLKYISIGEVSDTAYLSEGCHGRAYLDWQPKFRCNGQGERFTEIQCD